MRLPRTLTELGAGAFENSVSLEALDLSATALSVVGDGFAACCCSLADVRLPTGLAALGETGTDDLRTIIAGMLDAEGIAKPLDFQPYRMGSAFLRPAAHD